jgi:hypothetical protein
MPLDKQVVSLALTKGVDTKSDSKQLVPGSLVLLENGRFTEPGKIVKRPGNAALSQDVIGSGSQIESGQGLTSFREEILASNGTGLFSYSQGSTEWANKGPLFNITIDASSVVRNNYQQTSQDSCIHSSGIQCVVWSDSSGGVRYSIIDFNTKLQIVSNALISSTGSKAKCLALGNYFVIIYFTSSGNIFKKLCIPVVDPTGGGSSSDLVTDNTGSVYDAQVISNRIFFVYNNNSGNLAIRYINASLSVSTAETIASVVATSATIFGDDSANVWIALWNGTVTRVAIYSYELVSVLAIQTIETIANVNNITGVVIGSTANIFYDITSGTVYNYRIRYVTVTIAGVASAVSDLIRSMALGSKAFAYNDVAYVMGSYASTYQPTYFLINSEADVSAKISPLSGGGIPATNVIPQVNLYAEGIYQITYLQKNTTTAVDGVIVSQSGVQQATIDFTSLGLISSELADNLHIGGGFMAMYDGANLVEHGFHLFPEQPAVAQAASGSIANGAYQYVVVYEWMDNFGNIHRSAPSIPVSITTTGSNGTVNVTIPTLRVTAKTNVACVVYRTEASGLVFYRVSSLTSPTFNSTTADTVTFSDTTADSGIIGNNQLYTTGGEVENISVPATEIFLNFKNRIIAVPAENKSQWWYSKQIVPGFPVEFSDSLVNNMDQYGGEVRAVGVLDDKIIFFKENVKFYVYGSGPSAAGTNGNYSEPERVTGDTGCVNQRSIVSTPMGLMYQSPKGIYLLGRDIVDKYIGSPVEDYTQGFEATSAVLMAENNQVRFTMDSGVTLVYDYFVDQWSVDSGLSARDSTLWMGANYATIRSSGQVLIEDPSIYTDAGRFVKLKMKTGWINFAQVQGFQRVRKMLLLGEYKSPHRLRISIAENFNGSAFQNLYINAGDDLETEAYGDDSTYGSMDYYGGAFPSYNFRVFLERQKCTSLQVTIEDTQSSNFGEGYSLSNIAFEVGVKKGLNKLKAGASYG